MIHEASSYLLKPFLIAIRVA